MKKIPTGKWCYSGDGEYFSSEEYDTKEQAITDCLADYGSGSVGEIVKLEFDENDICYDETGYHLMNVLYDEVGDVADSWEMTNKQDDELAKILAKEVVKYINEHNLQPSCFGVVNVEEV